MAAIAELEVPQGNAIAELPVPQSNSGVDDALAFRATAGPLRRGFRSGMNQTGAMMSNIVGQTGEAMGLTEFAESRFKAAKDYTEFAESVAPEVRDYRQIQDLSDMTEFVLGHAGSGVATSLPALGLALGLRRPVAGVFAGSAPLVAGEHVGRLREDPHVMENLSPGQILGEAAKAGVAGGLLEVAGGAEVQAARRILSPSQAVGGVGKAIGKAALGEAAVETGQELIGTELQRQVSPDTPPPEIHELINAALAGAVGGGAIGGASAAVSTAVGAIPSAASSVARSADDFRQRITKPRAPIDPDGDPVIPDDVTDPADVVDLINQHEQAGVADLAKVWEQIKDHPDAQRYAGWETDAQKRAEFSADVQQVYADNNIKPEVDAAVEAGRRWSEAARGIFTSKRSEMRTAVDDQIQDSVVSAMSEVHLNNATPEQLMGLADAVKSMAQNPDQFVDTGLPAAMRRVFGDEFQRVIEEAVDAVHEPNEAKRIKAEIRQMYKQKGVETEERLDEVRDIIRNNLDPYYYTSSEMRRVAMEKLAPRLLEFIESDGDAATVLAPARAEEGALSNRATNDSFMRAINTAFGENTEAVLDALDDIRMKEVATSIRQYEAEGKDDIKGPETETGIPVVGVEAARAEMERLQKKFPKNQFRVETLKDLGEDVYAMQVIESDTVKIDSGNWQSLRDKYGRSGYENGVVTVRKYRTEPTEENPSPPIDENKISIPRLTAMAMRMEGSQTAEGSMKYVRDMYARGIASLTNSPMFAGFKGEFNPPPNTPIAVLGRDKDGNRKVITLGMVRDVFFGQAEGAKRLRAKIRTARAEHGPAKWDSATRKPLNETAKAYRALGEYYSKADDTRKTVEAMEEDALTMIQDDGTGSQAILKEALEPMENMAKKERAIFEERRRISANIDSTAKASASMQDSVARSALRDRRAKMFSRVRELRPNMRLVGALERSIDRVVAEADRIAGNERDAQEIGSVFFLEEGTTPETLKAQTEGAGRKFEEDTFRPVGEGRAAEPVADPKEVKPPEPRDKTEPTIVKVKTANNPKNMKSADERQGQTDWVMDAIKAEIRKPTNSEYKKFSEMFVGKGRKHITEEQKKEVRDYVSKVLGKEHAEVLFKKMAHAGEFANLDGVETLTISVNSLDPMSVARHEAMHAFFARLLASDKKAAQVLLRAAGSPTVVARLNELLKDHPKARKQLADPEERLAYMYQFWAAGDMKLLNVGPETKTVFDGIKAFFRKIAAVWAEDMQTMFDVEQAGEILDAFHRGEFSDRSTVSQVINERVPRAAYERATGSFPTLGRLMNKFIWTAQGAVRDMNIPAATEIVDKFISAVGDTGKESGYLQVRHVKANQWVNRVADVVGNMNETQMANLMAELRSGQPRKSKEAKAIEKVLNEAFDYMVKSGVKRVEWVKDPKTGEGEKVLRDLTKIEGPYFPRVPNPEYTAEHRAEFMALLKKHGIYNPEQVFDSYTRTTEMTSPRDEDPALGLTLYTPQVNQRTLNNIPDAELAPFLNQDLVGTLSQYLVRAGRRSEYTKRFGNFGELIDQAKKTAIKDYGMTPAQERTFDDSVGAMEGTIGANMDPRLRQLYGAVTTYQNIRLLPLALFSQVVDAGGIWVRGGTAKEALGGLIRGIRDIPRHSHDEMYYLAKTVGSINIMSEAAIMADMYSSQFMPKGQKRVNELFFKYNGMEGWNRSMREAATMAAHNFLIRHTTKPNDHSERYLKELNIEAKDVKLDKNGKLVLNEKTMGAINAWVDSAIIRPHAANRPVYMSDPQWILVSHLKQFAYMIQKVVVARAYHEIKNGNYSPVFALMSYVPLMIASDMMRIMITPGSGDDDMASQWDMGDWIWRGIQRSALFGPSQFILDAGGDMHTSRVGFESIAGPTAAQLTDFVRKSVDGGDVGGQLVGAIPGARLFR